MIKSTMADNALRTAALWGALILGMGAASAQGMPGGMSGPVNVGVITAETQNVPFTVTLPARAVAFQDAKIRPTVEGIVESVDYEPGARVSAGDLMFTLRKDR